MTEPHAAPSDDQLKAAVSEVVTQFTLALGSSKAAINHTFDTGCPLMDKALSTGNLRAYPTYLRPLFDFLYADVSTGEPLVALDFFDDPSLWIEERPEPSERMIDAVVRLREGRYSDIHVRWNIEGLTVEIESILRRFQRLADSSKTGTELKEFLKGLPVSKPAADPQNIGPSREPEWVTKLKQQPNNFPMG